MLLQSHCYNEGSNPGPLPPFNTLGTLGLLRLWRVQVRVNTRLKVNRYISKKLQAERDAAAAAGTPMMELPNAPGTSPDQGSGILIYRKLEGF